jgi:GLPGLI family protein
MLMFKKTIKILFLTLPLFFSPLWVHSQGLCIVYEAFSIRSTTELNAVPDLEQCKIKYYYSLTIYKGISKFSRDSLYVHSFPSVDLTEAWVTENTYKDYENGLWIKQSSAYKEGYALQKNISSMIKNNDFDWEITGEKQTILGLECIKAVSPKGFTAWYAVKLPYPDGPRYGVFNLPGLVLVLETSQDKWVARQISTNVNPFVIPKTTASENESSIRISYNDIKSLKRNKCILVDQNTPKGKWLTFAEK